MTQGIRGSSPLWAAQAEPRAKGNCGVSPRGKEAGGKTTDTMNKNRIQGRDWLGKGAMDSGARNLCGSRHGKFGVACGEALSLIPGGPTNCQEWLWALRSVRKEGWESAEGVVAGANLCPAKAQTERQ